MTETVTLSPAGKPVRLDFGEAYIRPGLGVHRLHIEFKTHGVWLDPDPAGDGALLLLEGHVWLDAAMKPVAALAPQVLTLRGFPCSGEQIAIFLTDDQLTALEIARGLDDVRFRIDLQVTVLGQPPSVHPSQTAQMGYRIAARRWLELLDQAGAEVGITIRVPSPLTDSATWDGNPLPDDAPSLFQAGQRLRQARLELRDGATEHCVATCRKVLENVRRLRPLPSAAEVFKIKPENRTQEQRWAALYHDLVSLTNAAHHDDAVAEGFVWSRADAEAVLASTAGVLARLRS